MKASRERLATRVIARLSGKHRAHPFITQILSDQSFHPAVRSLAVALVMVELDQRGLCSRIPEYLYASFRLPGYQSVTVGPPQLAVNLLLRPVASCYCAQLPRVPWMHCLRSYHQVAVLLTEVERLRVKFADLTRIANAFHKGESAIDLALPTVYSRVVLALFERRHARTQA